MVNQEYSMDNRNVDINLNPRFPYTKRECELFECDVASNALLPANEMDHLQRMGKCSCAKVTCLFALI